MWLLVRICWENNSEDGNEPQKHFTPFGLVQKHEVCVVMLFTSCLRLTSCLWLTSCLPVSPILPGIPSILGRYPTVHFSLASRMVGGKIPKTIAACCQMRTVFLRSRSLALLVLLLLLGRFFFVVSPDSLFAFTLERRRSSLASGARFMFVGVLPPEFA